MAGRDTSVCIFDLRFTRTRHAGDLRATIPVQYMAPRSLVQQLQQLQVDSDEERAHALFRTSRDHVTCATFSRDGRSVVATSSSDAMYAAAASTPASLSALSLALGLSGSYTFDVDTGVLVGRDTVPGAAVVVGGGGSGSRRG